jgi:sporulation integral membrane protein YtvI
MKFRERNLLKLKWIFTLVLITLGVYLSFRYLLPLILPFIIAYFLAWIIRPVTELLFRKLRIPRILGSTFSLLLLVGVFGTAFCLLINILIQQATAIIRNIPVYLNIIGGKLDAICNYCDRLMGVDCGTIRAIVDDHLTESFHNLQSSMMPKLTQHTITITIWVIGFISIALIIFVAAVLIAKDLPEFHKRYDGNSVYRDIHKVTGKLSEAGIAYLRTQLIIMVIVALVCVFALVLIKNDYALLIGLGIAIMDALPVLGSGIALIPWSIVMLIKGNIYAAAILFTAYLITQVVREVLEPKLIGNRIGIKPLYTLIAMYVGVKLFSIAGFFLGPIGLVIIMTVYKALNEKAEAVENDDDINYNEE